jgi:two-component sensor histidine kinase
VANELIANAVEHGRPPIDIALRHDRGLRLTVTDHGDGPGAAPSGLGLQLVQRIVTQGLRGSFTLHRLPEGGTEAQVTFEPADGCGS